MHGRGEHGPGPGPGAFLAVPLIGALLLTGCSAQESGGGEGKDGTGSAAPEGGSSRRAMWASGTSI